MKHSMSMSGTTLTNAVTFTSFQYYRHGAYIEKM